LNKKYQEENDLLKRKSDEVGQELDHLKSKFAALGDKPCWLNEKRQPEIVFLVRIFDDGVEVLPRWPANRNLEGSLAPAKSLNRRISMSEFRGAFLQLFRSSKKEQCRHYVSLEIFATSGALATENRANVETYFYTRDVRNMAK
jgi:hypothetical protein